MSTSLLKIKLNPFALSLSKGRAWFDKLTMSGICHIGFHQLGERAPTLW